MREKMIDDTLEIKNNEMQKQESTWELLKVFLLTSLIAGILCVAGIFAFRAVSLTICITGNSMNPTLKDEDIVVFLSLEYFSIDRGDIVSIDHQSRGERIVKRVIGVAGDVIEIDPETASVYVNGELLEEPYLGSPTTELHDIEGPVTVEEGHVFVMGDNREHSVDSRYNSRLSCGQIPVEWIEGKALAVVCNRLENDSAPLWMWKPLWT